QIKASSAMSENWLKAPDADLVEATARAGEKPFERELSITKGASN
ncbi:unnamed protein product, partial [marine sediment metagenome]